MDDADFETCGKCGEAKGEHLGPELDCPLPTTKFEGTGYPTLDSVVERMKKEILADIESGTVPRSVKTFSGLHDHVDANCYGGFCEEGNPWDPSDEDDMQFMNDAQGAVDEWLKGG